MNNAMIRSIAKNNSTVCLNCTIVDGLVLAKSSFHSSCNYRSVCLFGKFAEISESEKLKGLELITNHVCSDRWNNSRQPNKGEMKGKPWKVPLALTQPNSATSVLKLIITSGSAKIRNEGVGDLKADLQDEELAHIWSGRKPLLHFTIYHIIFCQVLFQSNKFLVNLYQIPKQLLFPQKFPNTLPIWLKKTNKNIFFFGK